MGKFDPRHRKILATASRYMLIAGWLGFSIGMIYNAEVWHDWWRNHIVTITVTQVSGPTKVCTGPLIIH